MSIGNLCSRVFLFALCAVLAQLCSAQQPNAESSANLQGTVPNVRYICSNICKRLSRGNLHETLSGHSAFLSSERGRQARGARTATAPDRPMSKQVETRTRSFASLS